MFFFSRIFAELLRELLARLDDEPRERALLLARARGVAPRYPPVLMFHVFLSCIQRAVEVSVRASDFVAAAVKKSEVVSI